MKQEKARLHVLLYGRVQGVGFRWYALRQAEGMGLTGWVRNRYDGAVELTAEGPRPSLEAFLDYLKAGPGMARVESVEATWGPGTGEFSDFRVMSSGL